MTTRVKVHRKLFAIKYDLLAEQENALEEFRRVTADLVFKEAKEAREKAREHAGDYEYDVEVERIDENRAYVNLFFTIQDDAKAMMFRLDTEVGGS